jgi:hypothetical protein
LHATTQLKKNNNDPTRTDNQDHLVDGFIFLECINHVNAYQPYTEINTVDLLQNIAQSPCTFVTRNFGRSTNNPITDVEFKIQKSMQKTFRKM